MKFYLQPKGWPTEINAAPNGLLARVRKGKMYLYFHCDGKEMNVPPFTMDEKGNLTKVTGTVTPVELRTEK